MFCFCWCGLTRSFRSFWIVGCVFSTFWGSKVIPLGCIDLLKPPLCNEKCSSDTMPESSARVGGLPGTLRSPVPAVSTGKKALFAARVNLTVGTTLDPRWCLRSTVICRRLSVRVASTSTVRLHSAVYNSAASNEGVVGRMCLLHPLAAFAQISRHLTLTGAAPFRIFHFPLHKSWQSYFTPYVYPIYKKRANPFFILKA